MNSFGNIKKLNFFGTPEMAEKLTDFIINLLQSLRQPSAQELLDLVEKELGIEARWDLEEVVSKLARNPNVLTRFNREYLQSMIESGSLAEAIGGKGKTARNIESTIDDLLRKSKLYRSSEAFKEMINFMGRFREYAPYNNLLVKVQNPSCGFYATGKDWEKKFHRVLKEDARPMLILAPMHPVMLVYDLDQTEGELPFQIKNFAHFDGQWNPEWMSHLLENAKRHRIRVDFKTLSSTHGGFATITRGTNDWKMRIAVHAELNEPSRFGVLCHEMAHILLGHLGTDKDNWWPSRINLTRRTVEIEAEAVAFIVTNRLELTGHSAAYLSRYLTDGRIPSSVSLDFIAKVSGKIERMATELIPAPKKKKRP